MGGTTHDTRRDPREAIVLAIILIAVGAGALALQVMPDAGAWIVLLIGLGLVGVFLALRQYGALVPGGIMTGLGAGILASDSLSLPDDGSGGAIVLGLGVGFLAIWVIGGLAHVPEQHPWPLIPGGILSVVGAALLLGGAAEDLLRYWPVIIIGLGLVVLWQAWARSRNA